MAGIVYINGEYSDAADAKISIFDRGLLFADSVYEVLPVYNGRVLFAANHLKRLENSLNAIRIKQPKLNWLALFKELIQRNGDGDMQIYVQITRGNENLRKHDISPALAPTIIAFTMHNPYPSFAAKQQGLSAYLEEDIRWQRCDIKTTALLANILLNDDAMQKGAQTVILSRNGYLTEGGSTNVFLVDAHGIILTPALNNFCLPGITRELTIALIHELGLPFRESKITIESVFNAQEIWVTSTTKEIYPVTRLNDKTIGNGYGGKLWLTVHDKYQSLIKKLL